MRSLPILFAASVAIACAGTPAIAGDQVSGAIAADAQTHQEGTEQSPEAIDSLRDSGELAAARAMALAYAAERPDDPEALWRASRAESDAVWLHGDDKEARDKAAASALDYARRADAAGAASAEAIAQYAWSMGNSTHLKPMMARSAHARATDALVDRALELDPENADALATRATLQLRLQTLPRVAKIMAARAPDSSLAGAEKCARAAIGSRPSLSNALLLAKILVADDRRGEARDVLAGALAKEDKFPRDREVRSAAQAMHDELEAEGSE